MRYSLIYNATFAYNMIDTSFLLSIGYRFSILTTTLNVLSRFFNRWSIHLLDLLSRTSLLIRHLSKFVHFHLTIQYFNNITFFYHLIDFRKFFDFNVFMLKEFIFVFFPILKLPPTFVIEFSYTSSSDLSSFWRQQNTPIISITCCRFFHFLYPVKCFSIIKHHQPIPLSQILLIFSKILEDQMFLCKFNTFVVIKQLNKNIIGQMDLLRIYRSFTYFLACLFHQLNNTKNQTLHVY